MKKIISLFLTLILVLSFIQVGLAEDYGRLISRENWGIWASSSFASCGIGNAFDGSKGTFWNGDYTHENGVITWVAPHPQAINIMFPETKKVSGLVYTPRQDEKYSGGIVEEYAIFVSVDGVEYKQVAEGKWTYKDRLDREDRYVSWGDIDARCVQFEIYSGNGGHSTAAEINLLTGGVGEVTDNGKKPKCDPPLLEKEDGQYLEKDNWKLDSSSAWPNNEIEKAFDGKSETFWTTLYYVDEEGKFDKPEPPPHWFTVEFPKATEVSGFDYVRRDKFDAGKFQNFEVYASIDGKDENFEKIYTGNLPVQPGVFEAQRVSWGNVLMKKLKVVITKGWDNQASAAEIKLLEGSTPAKRVFDTSNWTVKVDSEMRENSSVNWGPVTAILDDNPTTRWHSYYDVEGSNMINICRGQYWITITLPEKDVITGWKYVPRDNDWQGRLEEYDVLISDTDDGEWTTIYKGKSNTGSANAEYVDFGIGVEIKRLQIHIKKSANGFGSISDFILTPGEKDTKVVKIEDFESELYETYLKPIDSKKFSATSAVEADGSSYRIAHLFDGGTSTSWMTKDTTAPFSLQIDLGKKHIFREIHIAPRTSSSRTGLWELFDMKVSGDGVNYQTIVTDAEMSWELETLRLALDEEVEARNVVFDIKKFPENRVACAEITFLQTDKMKDSETAGYTEYIMQIGSNEIKEISDGGEFSKTVDAAPYITQVGSTLIPLRGLMEMIGATVKWIDEDQTIIITHDEKNIKFTMQVENDLVWKESSDGKRRYTLTVAPRIKEGRTYIPVRFVTEHLGFTVDWDGESKTITMH